MLLARELTTHLSIVSPPFQLERWISRTAAWQPTAQKQLPLDVFLRAYSRSLSAFRLATLEVLLGAFSYHISFHPLFQRKP